MLVYKLEVIQFKNYILIKEIYVENYQIALQVVHIYCS